MNSGKGSAHRYLCFPYESDWWDKFRKLKQKLRQDIQRVSLVSEGAFFVKVNQDLYVGAEILGQLDCSYLGEDYRTVDIRNIEFSRSYFPYEFNSEHLLCEKLRDDRIFRASLSLNKRESLQFAVDSYTYRS